MDAKPKLNKKLSPSVSTKNFFMDRYGCDISELYESVKKFLPNN
jgi:hypothetical protein